MGTGWVQGGAIPGYYPASTKGGPRTAKRAPEALQGLEWVVLGRNARCGGGDGPGTTPAGPGRSWPARPSLSQDLSECRLWANNGEI